MLARHGLPVPRDASLLRDARGATLAGLYRYVEGRPAHPRGRAERARLAAALSAFLNALHAIDPVEIDACAPLHYHPWRDEFAPMVERCVPLLGAASATWVRRVGERLRDASRRMPRSVIVHADLKPEHVLLDGSGGIAAILDFEGVRVSDSALEAARLIQNWDRRFAELVLRDYAHPVDPGFMTRAECYRELDALQAFDHALARGLEEWVTWARRSLAARAAVEARRSDISR